MDDLTAIIRDFLVETNEHLDRLDGDLLALESRPDDAERLASAFRAFHTIKGTCGWFNFNQLELLAHSAESLLGALRDGSVHFNTSVASSLLQASNVVRRALPIIEATHGEGSPAVDEVRAQLESHLQPSSTATGNDDPVHVWSAAFEAETDDAISAIADRTVRIDVQMLDHLMNQVGELVLARNQIVQGVPAATQRLRVITAELQQAVIKARMQPIGTVWNTLPRLTRDAALAVGKEVKLLLTGQDTAVDRSLLQAVRDPMTHLVRNAVDHGIELPAERLMAGKVSHGTLRVHAFHQNGQVVLEVSDDGAGLDLARIKGVAVARKLITAERAAVMTDRELTQLVFLPGFSTRQAITTLSGRGVGLDVVKTHIDGIGGSIEIETKRGVGTTLRMKMPLTLAIIHALSIRSGGLRFAIPQTQIIELVRVPAPDVERALQRVHDAPVLRLRGALLPLVDLAALLGMPAYRAPAPDSDASVTVIVVEALRQHFGLIVDGVGDTEEIVVKALAPQLKALRVYSGTTVMSDGRVGLILDVPGIAESANVLAPDAEGVAAPSIPTPLSPPRRYLIAASRDGGQVALPLESVIRLEELDRVTLEMIGSREVVQYRGGILPLVRLRDVLEERRKVARDAAHAPPLPTESTIVCVSGQKRLGVIVDRIIDVVDDTGGIIGPATRRGVVGTVVAFGKVAELIDLEQIASNA